MDAQRTGFLKRLERRNIRVEGGNEIERKIEPGTPKIFWGQDYRMNLIGLDIGTTSCKAVLFNEDGTILAKAGREFFVDFPHTGWAEQNAEKVWQLAQESLRELLTMAGNSDVAGISLSVQGEAVMPVDENGRALRPMMPGMDTRTGSQNEWLSLHLGAAHLFELTGMPVHTINTLPKLLWIKDNEPEIWQQASRFVLFEDYLMLMMTGTAAISTCLASAYTIVRSAARRLVT